MSQNAKGVSPDNDPIAEGLFEFFASQADVMLAQYNNISQLLGPTTDWTHPGTHCEVLLRNFLRKFVPARYGVDKGYIFGRTKLDDKGYIFGRTKLDDKDTHCPEIDILIHDVQNFRPVYRLEDFVIVQPGAVKAIIQVKRSLRSGEDGSFNRGLKNVIEAKQHWIDMLRLNAERVAPEMGHFSPSESVFSAVVGFEHHLSINDPPFHEYLVKWREEFEAHWRGMEQDTSIFVLPEFFGSLSGQFVITSGTSHLQRIWHVFKSEYDGKNIALQYFLLLLTKVLSKHDQSFPMHDTFPSFAFPSDIKEIDQFTISCHKESTKLGD